MALTKFELASTETADHLKPIEKITDESAAHIHSEFTTVAGEIMSIHTKAAKAGDTRVFNGMNSITKEISTGLLSDTKIADVSTLPKVFKRVEEVAQKYKADPVLIQNLAAMYLTLNVLRLKKTAIDEQVEVASFAFMLVSSAIASREFDVTKLKTSKDNDNYKPGAVTSSIGGLLSYMLTARDSDSDPYRNIAKSVELGMTTAKVFLEKQGRKQAATEVLNTEKGIRGEMVASEALSAFAENINLALNALNGEISPSVNRVMEKVGAHYSNIQELFPPEELSFYEEVSGQSFGELFADRGWAIVKEKIESTRSVYYPYFLLAKRLREVKGVRNLDIKRTTALEDYLGFSDFEIVGSNNQGERYQLPVDVKTLSAEEFEKDITSPEDGILADLVHSKVLQLTGNQEEDDHIVESLARPPSATALRNLSASRQPILLLRIKSDVLSRPNQETTIQSQDISGKRIFAAVVNTVDIESIPHASEKDLLTLADAVNANLK